MTCVFCGTVLSAANYSDFGTLIFNQGRLLEAMDRRPQLMEATLNNVQYQ